MNIGIEVSEKPLVNPPQGAKQLFASYHILAQDNSFSGFGNIVTYFYPEEYNNKMDKFIVELQKQITMIQEERLGKKVIVQVLFFR